MAVISIDRLYSESVSDTLGDDGAAAANDVDTRAEKKPYGFPDFFFFFFLNTAGGELLLLLTVIQSMFRVVSLSVLRQDLNASQWERGENAQI